MVLTCQGTNRSWRSRQPLPGYHCHCAMKTQHHSNLESWHQKGTYQLSIDEEKQQVVLRTSNKKYFKRFCVPSLRRTGIDLEPSRLSLEHANATLTIRYAKPPGVLELEAKTLTAIGEALRSGGSAGGTNGDVGCAQQ